MTKKQAYKLFAFAEKFGINDSEWVPIKGIVKVENNSDYYCDKCEKKIRKGKLAIIDGCDDYFHIKCMDYLYAERMNEFLFNNYSKGKKLAKKCLITIGIIEDQLEYFKMSINDLAKKTNIKAETISGYLDGSVELTEEALSYFEPIFKLERYDLVNFYKREIASNRFFRIVCHNRKCGNRVIEYDKFCFSHNKKRRKNKNEKN